MSAAAKPASTAADPSAVKLERQGGVAILRLDDPATMNALSPSVKAGMMKHVPTLLADDSVRCIVLTGTGKAFCAGGDIRSMKDPEQRKAPRIHKRMKEGHSWSRPLLDCDKPVINILCRREIGKSGWPCQAIPTRFHYKPCRPRSAENR